MPTTKTATAAPASLIDRITAKLPEHAAHATATATLELACPTDTTASPDKQSR